MSASAPVGVDPSWATPVADDEVLVAELADDPGVAAPPVPESRHWTGLADRDELRARWEAIRVGFVDEPQRAVEQADTLVVQVIQALASSLAQERARLEGQWAHGGGIDTEDLRVTLQRYGLFFDDLLAH